MLNVQQECYGVKNNMLFVPLKVKEQMDNSARRKEQTEILPMLVQVDPEKRLVQTVLASALTKPQQLCCKTDVKF